MGGLMDIYNIDIVPKNILSHYSVPLAVMFIEC